MNFIATPETMSIAEKPNTKKAALYCAALLANLEGQNIISLPEERAEAKAELFPLNQRLRALELKMSVIPPPPMLEPTWESFVWRISRLRRQKMQLYPRPDTLSATILAMLPNSSDVSVEEIMAVVNAIPSRNTSTQPLWLRTRISDEDEAFCLALQHVCHIKGQRNQEISHQIVQQPQLYAAAINISLDLESAAAINHCPPPGFHGGLKGPAPAPIIGCRACSCRCSCICHSVVRTSKASRPMVSYLAGKKPSLKQRIRGWKWVKTLFCMRSGKKYFSDDSSTDGSIRIVDD